MSFLTMLGTGIAIVFAIIALSAITLYLSFRIKETFKDDSRTRVQFAKIAFMLAILILASSLFYFMAQALNPAPITNNTTPIQSSPAPFSIPNISSTPNGFPMLAIPVTVDTPIPTPIATPTVWGYQYDTDKYKHADIPTEQPIVIPVSGYVIIPEPTTIPTPNSTPPVSIHPIPQPIPTRPNITFPKPTVIPTIQPTMIPVVTIPEPTSTTVIFNPTIPEPTINPTIQPTANPTVEPTINPIPENPTTEPTVNPTSEPTVTITSAPTTTLNV